MTASRNATKIKSRRIGEELLDRRNNFDVLRLVAATMVLVSHSFPLTGQHEPGFIGTHETLGFVGVLIFFAISGLLVTRSWDLDRHLAGFVWKRALRIAPGLFVSCLVTAYVIGALVTSEPLGDYLLSGESASYVVRNTLMLTNYSLPGVFDTNPSHTINGSLGTLPVEIKAYALLALTGVALATGAKMRRALLGLIGLILLAVAIKTGVKSPATVVTLFALFAGAAGLYLLRDRIPLHPAMFVAATAGWMLSYRLPVAGHAILMALTFPYVVAFLGLRWLGRLRSLTRLGDVSYGIYIYAFPIEQLVIHLLAGDASPWLVVAIAAPTTYILGLLSWRVVERPALSQKRRFARPTAPPDIGVHEQAHRITENRKQTGTAAT